jgi:6-phosphogluconate dehydrogenase
MKGRTFMDKSHLGLIGLAVMGENLALNMERNGIHVAVFNRTSTRTEEFIRTRGAGKNFAACYSLKEFVSQLEAPRMILMMVKAGPAIDQTIQSLRPLLSEGDILIDGGNSFFKDTERRSKEIEAAGLHYLGVGVSGGEDGALNGPSIMPGGTEDAYTNVEPIFTAISAKVNGEPCVAYMGPRGAGHYVKMVHNGIEYGDMQLIAEAYDLMSHGLGMCAGEIADLFEEWNKGILSSYLVDITAAVLRKIDERTGKPLVDSIRDAAGQKGTGKWTSQEGFDLGYPIPTINAAVEARILSTMKEERVRAAQVFSEHRHPYTGNSDPFVEKIESALYASKICSYAQGMGLLRMASRDYEYYLDLARIAQIWRGGCIIRAGFLNDVSGAFRDQPSLANLLLAPFFRDAILERETAWRDVVCEGIRMGIPLGGMSASLAYFDSYSSERLPANLIQGQRDLFGAHTYERIDVEGVFHTRWANSSPPDR